MAHLAIQDRRTSLEFMRPRILAGHDPARVIREIVRECCATACRGVRVDLLHQLFVLCCAHGKHLRLDWVSQHVMQYVILPIDSEYDIYSLHEFEFD